uniref:guanylate kinase n=1 Tax=uncultured Eubacterium sp. TaxID=165185 RepID=UPI002597F631
MQKQNGKLFVISGPSGAGKGTIVNAVMDQADPSGTALSISMTTREPRPGEEDGVNYFFVTKEEFRRQIEAGGFLEYAEVYDHYYGTPKSKVMEKLNQGRDVILEIDIQGALNVKKAFPEGVLIFILPPSMEVLRNRLTGRGTDAPEVIE